MSDRRIGRRIARALLASSALIPPMVMPARAVAAAAQSPAPATVNLNIPAQDLGSALSEFARQSNQQLLYSPKLVKGKTSAAVSGSFAPADGLHQLLGGSGISFKTASSGAFLLSIGTPQGNAVAGGPNAGTEIASSKGQADTGLKNQNGAEDQAILVTGSRLGIANPSVPVKIHTAQEIQESGQTTAADFLNTLAEVSLQSHPNGINAGAGQTNVQLHGFPAGTTAILLNGRRLSPSPSNFGDFDLGALPLAFIERIDVLPSGSSAIYGSDAIAGVVNFITKRNVSGVHLSASIGRAADYTEQNYSAAWGKTWDRGALSVVASYDTHDALFGYDRDIINNADYRRFAAQGGTDRRVKTCAPGNVFSTTTADLPGLNSTFAAIPAGVMGRPAVGAFSATQGTSNLCAASGQSVQIPAVDRKGILATGRYQISGSLEVFTEVLYTHTKTSVVSPLSKFSRTVPASNAFNPFAANVNVMTELAIPSGSVTDKNYVRPLVGLRGRLLSNWHWEVALWRSQDHSATDNLAVTQSAPLAAALASSDPNMALNPFSSTNPGPASVIANVFPTRSKLLFNFDANVVNGVVRGQLFDLPAGPARFAIGGEYQWQTFFNDPRSLSPATAVTDVSRQVGAVYSELRLPILGPRRARGDLLDVTVAGRYDHYNDFGSKATPQVGVEVRPTEGLLLRGSYARAFKAPQLQELYGAQISSPGRSIPDNGRPGDPITPNVLETFGGNRHLQPETGDAYSLGLVWSGRGVQGLNASFDYWWLGEDSRISAPTAAGVLGNPDIYPGRVVRDANGVLLSVDLSSANFGALRAEGFDLNVRYTLETAWGEFSTSADWVRTNKFTAAVTPGAALIDRLGRATLNDAWAVKNKATLGLDFRQGRYSLHAAARYLGSYHDYATTPANTNRLGNYALFDFSGRFDLGGVHQNKYLQHAALTASIVNVFDKSPQYSNIPLITGYDPAQTDILGRVARVGLTLDW